MQRVEVGKQVGVGRFMFMPDFQTGEHSESLRDTSWITSVDNECEWLEIWASSPTST